MDSLLDSCFAMTYRYSSNASNGTNQLNINTSADNGSSTFSFDDNNSNNNDDFNSNLSDTSASSATDNIFSNILECYKLMRASAGTDDLQYVRALVTYYLVGIGGMAVSCLGLFGNLLSLVVLSRTSMKSSSTYTYLSALAVCDALFLVCFILLTTKDLRRPEAGEAEWMWDDVDEVHPYLFQYVHPVAFTLQVTSIWLTLAFTVDR